MLQGDPDALEAGARRLAAAASSVHRCAGRLAATGRDLHWRGEAAEAFRASLADDVARLRRTAESLEDAADAMHRHAAAVRERLAALAAARAAALELADRTAASARDAVAGAAGDVAGAAVSVVAEAARRRP
ncbi:MAG TPA: WXG100 family type VII secretion target [Mycobacteriales bacterium]|nr:WXG100 family type VII secretion target [Mycobacteriales bacterium]